MIKYEDIVNNATGTFPGTVAKNVTTPGAGDGTEFVAAVLDDIWGWHQALLDYAGLTPDVVTEAPGTSQMVEALKFCFGHPGEVVMWHGVEDPNTEYGCKLLPLEGQCVAVANYADLLAAVYVGDGNNANYPLYYRCDNSNGTARNTAGIYLKLADMRGMFARGYDPTGENDPYGDTRRFPGGTIAVLKSQACALEKHDHALYTDTGSFFSNCPSAYVIGAPAPGTTIFQAGIENEYSLKTQTTEGAQTSDDETRPINVQVKFCIRY